MKVFSEMQDLLKCYIRDFFLKAVRIFAQRKEKIIPYVDYGFPILP
jgi:hypothetical protein